jgi:hypothetical protein
MAIEIKGGATFNTDYLKNLKNFPAKNVPVKKKLIYGADLSSNINDVQLIAWNDFSIFLKDI